MSEHEAEKGDQVSVPEVKPNRLLDEDLEFRALAEKYLRLLRQLRQLYPSGNYWPDGGGCPH